MGGRGRPVWKNRKIFPLAAKELDSETGYYYFGARYYDPKVSMWISPDPAIGDYLPTGEMLFFPKTKFDLSTLPGQGGVYNSTNWNMYHYAGMNPVKLVDPDGRLQAPANLKFYGITSDYGAQRSDGIHQGMDQGTPVGTKLHALLSGFVVAADDTRTMAHGKTGQGSNYGMGNFIVIDHGVQKDGPLKGKHLYSRYLHNATGGNKVKVGDYVSEGDVITRSGNTGGSAGPHSHFDFVVSDGPNYTAQSPRGPKFRRVDPKMVHKHYGQREWTFSGEMKPTWLNKIFNIFDDK